jgi:tRNA-Thr(GGU) m(6)t(6)A37 methyltransferase TsaA
MPIQPTAKTAAQGTVELFPEFQAGLKDLEGFSHIILLYHFHQCTGFKLQVMPFLDTEEHGLFATRAPRRPNPIGISVVRLLAVQDGILTIENIDVLDGTPLLDIKPYVPEYQSCEQVRTGWLEVLGSNVSTAVSDNRFVK